MILDTFWLMMENILLNFFNLLSYNTWKQKRHQDKGKGKGTKKCELLEQRQLTFQQQFFMEVPNWFLNWKKKPFSSPIQQICPRFRRFNVLLNEVYWTKIEQK